MISILEQYDAKTAAGLLARAALSLSGGEGAFSRKTVVENELALRSALIAQAYAALGIEPGDKSPAALEQVGSYFDEQSDRLIGSPSFDAVEQRLLVHGTLPSDLYTLKVIPPFKEFLGRRFEKENHLLDRTVRMPMQEQHFGPTVQGRVIPMVSLFARDFETGLNFRNFTMLVVAQREAKSTLFVHHAVRIYPTKVNVEGVSDLISLLSRFTEVYGVDLVLGDQRGRFFFVTDRPVPSSVQISVPKRREPRIRTVAVSQFGQVDPKTGKKISALVMAIDMDLYLQTLEQMDFKGDLLVGT